MVGETFFCRPFVHREQIIKTALIEDQFEFLDRENAACNMRRSVWIKLRHIFAFGVFLHSIKAFIHDPGLIDLFIIALRWLTLIKIGKALNAIGDKGQ